MKKQMELSQQLQQMKQTIKQVIIQKNDTQYELEALSKINELIENVDKLSLFKNYACMFNAKSRVAPEKLITSSIGLAFF